jgi:hypothetical protein
MEHVSPASGDGRRLDEFFGNGSLLTFHDSKGHHKCHSVVNRRTQEKYQTKEKTEAKRNALQVSVAFLLGCFNTVLGVAGIEVIMWKQRRGCLSQKGQPGGSALSVQSQNKRCLGFTKTKGSDGGPKDSL